jgi:hypothetical protein
MTFVFYRERQKTTIFWKVCFWQYYPHSANNVVNQNVPSINYANTNAKFKHMQIIKAYEFLKHY